MFDSIQQEHSEILEEWVEAERRLLNISQLILAQMQIELSSELARADRDRAAATFQHVEQVMLQQMQALSRLMRALGAMRQLVGLGNRM